MFERINTGASAADQCAEAIRRRILAGELAVGERLPPERVLADSLGVNRLTLRAALGQLRAAGLVKVRQGSGYTVLPFERTAGPSLLPALVRAADDRDERAAIAADLLMLRRHLASAALTKLATTAFDPAPIREAVGAFSALAQRGADADALAAADIAIVAAVLDATGSVAFRLLLNPLVRAIDEFPALRAVIYRTPRENAAAYDALLAWLEAPNLEAIAPLMTVLAARDRESVQSLATP